MAVAVDSTEKVILPGRMSRASQVMFKTITVMCTFSINNNNIFVRVLTNLGSRKFIVNEFKKSGILRLEAFCCMLLSKEVDRLKRSFRPTVFLSKI